MSDLNITPQFLIAGDAVFTVSNPSGEHYTYQIQDSDLKDDRTGEILYFVRTLTGPNNYSDFTYLGMYDTWGFVTITKKSRYTKESKIVKVLEWAIDVIHGRKKLPDGYSIAHNGRCGKCGRRLTTPESIEIGIGPVCMEMLV